MKEWITTKQEGNDLIILIEPASKYDETYYTTQKQDDYCRLLRQQLDIYRDYSNNAWRNHIRKYNMSALIDFLKNFKDREKYNEVKIRFNY